MPDNVIKTDIQDYWRRSYAGDKEIPSSNVEWDVEVDYSTFLTGYIPIQSGVSVGSVLDMTPSTEQTQLRYKVIDFVSGDSLTYACRPDCGARAVCFIDESNKILAMSSYVQPSAETSGSLVAPNGTKKAILQTNSYYSSNITFIINRNSSRLYIGDKEVDIMYAGDKVAYAKHKDNLVTGRSIADNSNFILNTNNGIVKYAGSSSLNPYREFIKCANDILKDECVTISFDVTDLHLSEGIDKLYEYIYGLQDVTWNGPNNIVVDKVGHYSKTFRVLSSKYKNATLAVQFGTKRDDTGTYCIIKNFKVERNIVDTEYSIAPSVTDNRVKIGKHWYNTCTIGNQQWMSENLNEDLGGGTWEGYYDNDASYGVKGYGKLYTWDCLCGADETPSAAMAALLKDGWRVPTKSDFDTLVTTVGDANYANVKEKWYWNTPGTNENGFSAIGSGVRTTEYSGLDIAFHSWSSTISTTTSINRYNLMLNESGMSVGQAGYTDARSVRLVRDVPVTLSAPPTTGSAYVASVNGSVGWVSED